MCLAAQPPVWLIHDVLEQRRWFGSCTADESLHLFPPSPTASLCISMFPNEHRLEDNTLQAEQHNVSSHRMVVPVAHRHCCSLLSPFPYPLAYTLNSTAIAPSCLDWHCSQSLNLCTAGKSFSTQLFCLLKHQVWLVNCNNQNHSFPEWKLLSSSSRCYWRKKPKNWVWGTRMCLEAHTLNTCTAMKWKRFTSTFPQAGI